MQTLSLYALTTYKEGAQMSQQTQGEITGQ